MAFFDSAEFLPESAVAKITDVRVADPVRLKRAARARIRRPKIAPGGRINMIAADHPARRVTQIGGDSMRMADRRDLLARVARVLSSGAADGLLASVDLLAELLILDDMIRTSGGSPFLDNKVLVASLNRAGLANVCWEIDDAWTGPTVAACSGLCLDGAKVLLRILDDDPASLATMGMVTEAARQAEAADLDFFLEPLPMRRCDDRIEVVQAADALAKIVGVAAALGDGGGKTWLKLPTCPDFGVVARATTLPIVILGGAVDGDEATFLQQIVGVMASGQNVRGTMIGRNVLYPKSGDPLPMARAIHAIVHDNADAAAATDVMQKAAVEPICGLAHLMQ